VLFIDTETAKQVLADGEEHHRVKLAWSCYGVRSKAGKWRFVWKRHTTGLAVCKYLSQLSKDKPGLWVFGHNLNFDLQSSAFYKHFALWEWQLDFCYDTGSTFILVVRKDGRLLRFISTTNYFEASLAEMGELVGLEKMVIDFDTCPPGLLDVYCKRDVQIIMRFMLRYWKWLETERLGRFRMTRGSQAFTAFRHRFMTEKIYLHRDEDVVGLERAAYMGGRTECFYLGKCKGGPWVSLDFNSMYPAIMRDNKFPVKLDSYHDKETVKGLEIGLRKYAAVAEVSVKTDWPWYAVRHQGKIKCPVGEFRAFLCTPGLKHALEHGHLKCVHRVAYYKQGRPFREFVNYFYPRRLEYRAAGDRVHEDYCKKILNSLYGKFGQKQPIQHVSECWSENLYERIYNWDITTGHHEVEYIMLNTRVIQEGFTEGHDSFCAISAHVTEAGRLMLGEIIHQLGMGTVLYCDTDSVVIPVKEQAKICHMLHDTSLGKLKVEKTYKSLEILGPKSYISDLGRVLKGIPQRAVDRGGHRYTFLRFEGACTHQLEQVTDYTILRPAQRQLSFKYDKATVLPTGFTTPFVFSPGD